MIGVIITMNTNLLIPTAEAAFIATLSDRHMNRVVDEQLMPGELFEQQGSARRFTRLSAAFAKFYFDDRSWLVASARRQVLDELTQRVGQLQTKDDVFALLSLPDRFNWKVANFSVEVDMAPYVADVFSRVKDVNQAHALVTLSQDVMGGVAVFAGTRVPLDMVLGSIAAGVDMDRLKASYAFLTDAHIQAAQVYDEVHPRRGRPRRLADTNTTSLRRVNRVVRRVTA
jgi:uncharacterized protein (DUF433 family)